MRTSVWNELIVLATSVKVSAKTEKNLLSLNEAQTKRKSVLADRQHARQLRVSWRRVKSDE